MPSDLPPLKPEVRVGKTALWIPYKTVPNWSEYLLIVFNDLLQDFAIETSNLIEF